MAEVTRILEAIEAGETQAAGQLLPLVYDAVAELKKQHSLADAQTRDFKTSWRICLSDWERTTGRTSCAASWPTRKTNESRVSHTCRKTQSR